MAPKELKVNRQYIVKKILAENEDTVSRFYKLGLFPGAEIELIRKAPIFGDPLLFDIDGSQIAMTKREVSFLSLSHREEVACH